MATDAVTKAAVEAKEVAKEQEAKRATDASARGKITRPNALEAALAAQAGPAVAVEEPPAESAGTNLPGAMETADGGSAEVLTHSEQSSAPDEDLSPEERAVHVQSSSPDGEERRDEAADEDAETAALAEGRTAPPLAGSQGI
jgi:hypothetical protein